MSLISNGECLSNIPFRYLTSTGWSESFANPLIVTTLAKACAAHEPLYKQHCTNNHHYTYKVWIYAKYFHCLNAGSYLDLVDVHYKSWSCRCSLVSLVDVQLPDCDFFWIIPSLLLIVPLIKDLSVDLVLDVVDELSLFLW